MKPKIISIQDIRSVEGASIITDMVNKRFVDVIQGVADMLDMDEHLLLGVVRQVLLDKEIPQDED